MNELKKQDLHSRRLLYKLIKLDQKTKNFTFYDTQMRKIFKIKHTPESLEGQTLISQITDESANLTAFWTHIDEIYFHKLHESDLQRLDYLKTFLQTPLEGNTTVYPDYQTYWAKKEILNSSFLKTLFKNDVESYKKNNENIVLHQEISLTLHKTLSNYPNLKPKRVKELSKIILAKYLTKSASWSTKHYLQEESKILNEFLRIIAEETASKANAVHEDALEKEIRGLERELKLVNKENITSVESLKEILDKDKSELESVKIETDNKNNIGKRKTDLSDLDTNLALTAYQLRYLKRLILHLEKRQMAETISKVTAVRRKDRAEMLYEITFEEALNMKPSVLDRKTLLELDTLRENSLLGCYRTSQKSLFSYISHNFHGFDSILSKASGVEDPQKEDVHLFKVSPLDLSPGRVRGLFHIENEGMAGFRMCHHCLSLFPNEVLFSCTYHSTVHSYNFSITHRPTANIYNTPRRRSISVNRTRNHHSYVRKNDELFCHRHFCRNCLSHNYDIKLSNITVEEFICPFCDGNCYCSRCLRNDTIVKLKDIFIGMGGNLGELTEESWMKKYMQAASIEEYEKLAKSTGKNSAYQQILKQKITFRMEKRKETLKNLYNLRQNMFKLQALCTKVRQVEVRMLKSTLTKHLEFENKLECTQSTNTVDKAREPPSKQNCIPVSPNKPKEPKASTINSKRVAKIEIDERPVVKKQKGELPFLKENIINVKATRSKKLKKNKITTRRATRSYNNLLHTLR